jgi:hypothetical protein
MGLMTVMRRLDNGLNEKFERYLNEHDYSPDARALMLRDLPGVINYYLSSGVGKGVASMASPIKVFSLEKLNAQPPKLNSEQE